MLPNLLTDTQLHELKESAADLKKISEECSFYKNSLSNLWRVLKKVYDKTDAQMKACDALQAKIAKITGGGT